jgi:SAM-dependent methyltransferase
MQEEAKLALIRARGELWQGMRPGRRPDLPVQVDMGQLRRLKPVDKNFGFGRGLPVDRFYIEQFLEANAACVRGRVLEIKDDGYARRYGAGRVTEVDVLDINPDNLRATLIGDLAARGVLAENCYDCIILTQTLQYIHAVDAALSNVERALKPGGALLLTVPGISKMDENAPWHWTFTEHSIRRLLDRHFPDATVDLQTRGNVLAATAFLQGIAAEELQEYELRYHDKDYVINIAARVIRAERCG